MKDKLVSLAVVGIISVSVLTGCVADKDVADQPEKPAVEQEVDVEDTDTTEDVAEEEVGPLTLEEIEELYGDDKMVMDVIENYIGLTMPNLDLVDRDGNVVNIRDIYPESDYIVEFMGTWCPVCEGTRESVDAFNETSDVSMIFVSGDEAIEDLIAFMDGYETPFYVAKSADEFNELLPIPFVPASFFVNSEGEIKMVGAGEMSPEFIEYIADRSFADE